METVFLAVIVALIVFVIIVINIFNSLVTLKNAVKNAWAQIDTQLKRRYDLIPNLIECVKGYMEHEKNTFELVVKARSEAMAVKDDIKARSEAENALSGTLKNLFALSENYPELKANQNFLSLQEELASTENKISFARTAYNGAVMMYSNKKEQFPSNIVALLFNFKDYGYFEINENEKEAIKVSF